MFTLPIGRSSCLLALAVLCLAVMAGPALAQSPAAEAEPSHYLASRMDEMREHVRRLAETVPAMPQELQRVAANFRASAGEGGVGEVALGALICLLAGAAVEWAFRRATSGMRARRRAAEIRRVPDRLMQIGIDSLLEALALVAFAVGAIAVLAYLKWPGPLHEAGVAFLTALLGVRLALAMLGLLLRPADGPDRSLAFFDIDVKTARFWYGWLAAFVCWFAVGWAIIAALRVLGLPPEGLQLLAYILGLGLAAIAIAIIWSQPAAARADGAPASNAARWLGSIAVVAFWLEWATGAMKIFWLLIVLIGLPIAIRTVRRASRHMMRPVEGEAASPAAASVASVLVEQGLRAVLIVGAILLLLWGWNLDVGSIAGQETAFTRLVRGALHALIILLMADLAWSLIKALADNALAKAQVAADNAEEARRRARVRTLLPIGRNVTFVVLAVMAGLMALSALGVEIGPLIASAGVVGVAVGFGAQTVVRDIFSGMFYMLDDAFRIGEYIQSGTYKGTVESFSLRSVKLRHQRGPLFTVPFGVLGAVQNMSRDWVMVKDVIGITHDSDIEKARKLIKQIGLDLAADPVMGQHIMQPLKMQGVQEFSEYGINVRTKMMTKPGEQFVIRRKAMALIKKAFDENGIRFSVPRVQIATGSGASQPDAEAMAAAAQEAIKPPKAAE